MANITLNCKKWGKFLSEISAYKLFNSSHPNSVMEQLLSPVCTVAYALGTLYSKPINNGFHIAVVGADAKEACNNGGTFRLLSKLLGLEHLRVDLVGPEVRLNPIYNPQINLRPNIGEHVVINLFDMTVGEYAKTHKPDVIMLNHPGFESHFEEWFLEQELPYVFDLGIEILGTSFATDEAELDATYLKAYGFTASEAVNNPYLIDHSKNADMMQLTQTFGAEAAAAGLMNWGGQVWRINEKSRKDDELIELLDVLRKNNAILASQLQDPSSLPIMFDVKDQYGDAWVLIRLEPESIFYSRDKAMIVTSQTGLVVHEDVELDVTYLKSRENKSIFQSMLMSAIINRDYGDEIDEFYEGGFGDNM